MQLDHVALTVADRERSAAFCCVRERFREAGVPEAEWQDDAGMARVQVLDPDGYRVDVYAYIS